MPQPPLAPTLRGYQRAWLGPDLVAGLTLLAIAVPEQMATARLANMPPTAGLYAFLAGSIVFVLLGTNPHMSIGADSTIAPVFAAGVAGVVAVSSTRYTDLVVFVAIAAGVLLAVVGLLRLGWIADFLPLPVVLGVLTGIGIEIAVRQLAPILGVPSVGTTTIGRLRAVYDERSHAHIWPIVIAAFVLALIMIAERIDHRLPGALVGVILATVAVAAFHLGRHGVQVLGPIDSSLPHVGLRTVRVADVRHLAGAVLTVVFLCIVQTAATARSGRGGPETAAELDRDLAAVGAAGIVSGLFGSFAVNSSPPRSAVVETSGGRTQATSLVAAGGVVVVLLIAGVLKDLPNAALGAVLIYIATRLLKLGELRQVRRFDRFEFGLAVVTILAVAFIGIEQGVLVAMLLAIGQRTRKAARPRGTVLGREPGTDHWIPPDVGRPTETVPGVLVYLPYAPLWYGNASYVIAQLRQELAAMDHPRALVLDADGVSDIDYTAARLFEDFIDELKAEGVTLGIARASHLVHHELKYSGLLARIDPAHFYPSVQQAVQSITGPEGR